MLILTRRVGETIIIDLPTGEQVEVTVLGVKGNQVRIGTDAPADLKIVREELLEKSQADGDTLNSDTTPDPDLESKHSEERRPLLNWPEPPSQTCADQHWEVSVLFPRSKRMLPQV